MTADRDFLFWLHERLIHKYCEPKNVDFVQKLEAIAYNTPPKVDTWVRSDRERFSVLGETSTVGPRWQVWDGEEHRAVVNDIPSETLAAQFAMKLNLWHRTFKEAELRQQQK